MNNRTVQQFIALVIASSVALLPFEVNAADAGDIRSHAEQSFERLKQQGEDRDTLKPGQAPRLTAEDRNSYSSDQYLVGKGQGDMAKGSIICQRVSELSARTDLAKQIRILVKEHMIDRIRERTGRDLEQDIEVTREEVVQEYLQGVKIVDRQIDETNKICSATAVMLKSQIQPKSALDHLEPTPTVIR
ncbi:MAG: hypothetical protein CAF45_009475 [Nitrospira sp. CG24E]|nr:MAG: hypothetical protein CAF45_009475 [Nitrospira sp. CG24E]